ncbi:MAG: hypothetical protein GXO26_07960 [Crenarchaeota archaeon]|nr:hypothetical protein [Thermoproteota archaeon]
MLLLTTVKYHDDNIIFAIDFDERKGTIRNNIVGKGKRYIAVRVDAPVIDLEYPTERDIEDIKPLVELIKTKLHVDVNIGRTVDGMLYIEIYRDHGTVRGFKHVEFISGILIINRSKRRRKKSRVYRIID